MIIFIFAMKKHAKLTYYEKTINYLSPHDGHNDY